MKRRVMRNQMRMSQIELKAKRVGIEAGGLDLPSRSIGGEFFP